VNPAGVAEGTLELRTNCLYLGRELLIWPAEYTFSQQGGKLVISGGGWSIVPGDAIQVGGGDYESQSNFPAPVIGGLPPCDGPYLWISKVVSVQAR
jgi:hypothetical protein